MLKILAANADLTYEKRTAKLKELWQDPEYRQKMMDNFAKGHAVATDRRSEISAELWRDPEFRAKISAHNRALWSKPEMRTKMSGIIKRLWQDPKFREKASAKQNRGGWILPHEQNNLRF